MQPHRTKLVLSIVLGVLLLSGQLASCASLQNVTPTPRRVGDQPTLVSMTSCSQIAQSAIQSKGLPINLIHSCSNENLKLDTGEAVTLILIRYGEGMDCPAGCIYEQYNGLYVDENQRLIDLPEVIIENGMWGQPPFNEWRTWQTENHSSKSYQTVALRNGYYGWVLKLEFYKFTLVYLKSAGADTQLGKRLYSSSGEIFVYLNSQGTETWDFSRFKTVTEDVQ